MKFSKLSYFLLSSVYLLFFFCILSLNTTRLHAEETNLEWLASYLDKQGGSLDDNAKLMLKSLEDFLKQNKQSSHEVLEMIYDANRSASSELGNLSDAIYLFGMVTEEKKIENARKLIKLRLSRCVRTLELEIKRTKFAISNSNDAKIADMGFKLLKTIEEILASINKLSK